jgi:hypothetical protein
MGIVRVAPRARRCPRRRDFPSSDARRARLLARDDMTGALASAPCGRHTAPVAAPEPPRVDTHCRASNHERSDDLCAWATARVARVRQSVHAAESAKMVAPIRVHPPAANTRPVPCAAHPRAGTLLMCCAGSRRLLRQARRRHLNERTSRSATALPTHSDRGTAWRAPRWSGSRWSQRLR